MAIKMMNFNFNNPTNLIFGTGTLNELGSQKLPGKKALLLKSNGKSTKTTGILDRVEAQLKRANAEYVICSNIHENPSKECVKMLCALAYTHTALKKRVSFLSIDI